jgi:hypothetical protein
VRVTAAPYQLTVTGRAGSTHSLTVQAYDFNPDNGPAVQSITVTLPP